MIDPETVADDIARTVASLSDVCDLHDLPVARKTIRVEFKSLRDALPVRVLLERTFHRLGDADTNPLEAVFGFRGVEIRVACNEVMARPGGLPNGGVGNLMVGRDFSVTV